jgi:hypothetical protein
MTPIHAAAYAASLLAELGMELNEHGDYFDLDDWLEDTRQMLAPLGEDGALILSVVGTAMLRAPEIAVHRAACELGRKLPGIIEHSDGDGNVSRPGEGGEAGARVLRKLLCPWRTE